MTEFGAFMGNMVGAGIVKLTGILLVGGYSYMPLFVFAAASYLLALTWLHLMLPTIRRV